jgi:type VI secretion system protein ImpL
MVYRHSIILRGKKWALALLDASKSAFVYFKKTSRKQVITALVFLGIAILVETVGPLITIAGVSPLNSLLSRLIFFLTLLFVWLYRHLPSDTAPPDINKLTAIAALQNNFKHAQILIARHTKKPQRSHYLVIGDTHAGKSSLLENAELDYIKAAQLIEKTPDEHANNSHSNWWVTSEGVLVDVPGYYISTEKSAIAHTLWLELLRLFRQKQPLTGVLITFDISAMLTRSLADQQLWSNRIKQCLQDISSHAKRPFSVYLLLTKVDQINGFMEFFDDLGSEERVQACGFNFPKNHPSDLSLIGRYHSEFDSFIKRLNERLIWRLHQERKLKTRTLIKNFPLQLENLRMTISRMIYPLSELARYHHSIKLRGIYFCSSTQQGTSVDGLQPFLSEAFEIDSNDTSPVIEKNQAYFVQELFNKIIFVDGRLSHAIKKAASYSKKQYASVCALLVTVLTGSGIYLTKEYQKKSAEINHAETTLAQYQIDLQSTRQNLNIVSNLSVLNDLNQAQSFLKQINLPWAARLHSSLPADLSVVVTPLYRYALQTRFLPSIRNILEQQLLGNAGFDPDTTYGALKMYLMLTQTQAMQATLFKNWFAGYWQQLLSSLPDVQQQLQNHLSALLAEPLPALPTNNIAITQARQSLTMMPTPVLAYTLLKNEPDVYRITLNQLSGEPRIPVFTNANLQNGILSIYTTPYFQELSSAKIEAASQQVLSGDWVLGINASKTDKHHNPTVIARELNHLYTSDYAKVWDNVLSNTQVIPFKNFEQARLVLAELTAKPSPMVTLLQTMADSMQPGMKFTAASLHQLLLSGHLNAVITHLTQLQNLMAQLATSHDIDQAAFTIAELHMNETAPDPISELQNDAALMPAPVNRWLNAISQNAWQLIASHTQTYLNHTWQTTVLPFYHQQVANRYPLEKSASSDASLSDFSAFFAPHGVLDSFYAQYLKPFVETTQAQWRWRSKNGFTLQLSNSDVLLQLERAALIRSMFFKANQRLGIQFILKPVAFEPGIMSLALDLNGQKMVSGFDIKQAVTLQWPSPDNADQVSLTFANQQGQQAHRNMNGPWAWFRLLDQSHLQQTTDTAHFELTFDLNGDAAQYALISDRPINPFIPGILDRFRCPETL